MPNDAQLVIRISAELSGMQAGFAQAKTAVRTLNSELTGATVGTKSLSGASAAAGASAAVMGSRFAAAAQKLQAEGLSASEVAGALRSLGASQSEVAALASATSTALAAQGTTAVTAASKVDRMTSAMAYGTARAVAFEAHAGPMGYVIGSIARASQTLAPILSSVFGVAIGVMAVQAIGDFVSKMLAAKEKVIELTSAMSRLTQSEYDTAESFRVENLKIEDQIAKLEGRVEPNGLAVALQTARIQADHLVASLEQVGEKEIETLTKGLGTWSSIAGLGNVVTSTFDPLRLKIAQLNDAMTQLEVKGQRGSEAYKNLANQLRDTEGEISQAAENIAGGMPGISMSPEQKAALLNIAVAYRQAASSFSDAAKRVSLAGKLESLEGTGGKESASEAKRRWELAHTSAASVHAKTAHGVREEGEAYRKAAEAIREYNEAYFPTVSGKQLAHAAARAAVPKPLPIEIPSAGPAAPTSGMNFGVGSVEQQMSVAEGMEDHIRKLQDARVISFEEMTRRLEGINSEMYRQQLIVAQEYHRKLQALEDAQMVHQSEANKKGLGDELGASLSKALMAGMTKREPNAMSIEMYNWFARSWDKAVSKLMTGGMTNIFQALMGKMESSAIGKGAEKLFSGITSQAAAAGARGLAQQKSVDAQSKLSSAKTASVHVFKDIASMGGPVAVPLAAAAAAGTFAFLMAFEKGGIVPQTGMAMVHKNEMVLPSSLAEHIKNSMRPPSTATAPGGAGAVHLHYTASIKALDSEGVADILNKHGEKVAATLQRYLRNKNIA